MSPYASNKIEGNPLTFNEVINAIESTKRHLLKPEQEIRNYYLDLELLNKKVTNRTIINRCTELTLNGYLKPIIVNKRLRKYEVMNWDKLYSPSKKSTDNGKNFR